MRSVSILRPKDSQTARRRDRSKNLDSLSNLSLRSCWLRPRYLQVPAERAHQGYIKLINVPLGT